MSLSGVCIENRTKTTRKQRNLRKIGLLFNCEPCHSMHLTWLKWKRLWWFYDLFCCVDWITLMKFDSFQCAILIRNDRFNLFGGVGRTLFQTNIYANFELNILLENDFCCWEWERVLNPRAQRCNNACNGFGTDYNIFYLPAFLPNADKNSWTNCTVWSLFFSRDESKSNYSNGSNEIWKFHCFIWCNVWS